MKLNADLIMREVREGLFQRRDGLSGVMSANSLFSEEFRHWSTKSIELKSSYSLGELLAFADRNFVENAYQAILRRPADPAGLQACLSRLRSGHATKVGILGNLRWSPEGMARAVHIDGLLVPFTLSKWRQRRFVGPIIGWLHAVVRLGSSQRRIDAVDTARAQQTEELGEILTTIASQFHERIAVLESTLEEDKRRQDRVQAFEKSLDPLYVAFEESFRGPLDLIRERAMPYLEIIKTAQGGTPEAPVLDLGCGRGDWLDLLKEHGLTAIGIDSNSAFLAKCRERGLDVLEGDVLELIRKLPDASIGAVTGMHIAEHLPFTVLIDLLDECQRVLVPGGVLALETPNPENLQVASLYFYNDPTHRNPLPPQTLSWLVEARGFANVEIKRWTIARELHAPELLPDDVPGADSINIMIQQMRAAPDYAVIGRRA
ncbi:methyltransferase domain-containing protein [Lysobacter sp. Hz 25]|uniref:methyltransferase domain-containing protein n=1 Tax=Lysobacter sp. Hz 25 TaxID=3383698 RepID=UPI0038D41CA1